MAELYQTTGIYNMISYVLVPLRDPKNAFLTAYKNTAHRVLLVHCISAFVLERSAQMQTVSRTFPLADTKCVILKLR